MNKDLYTKVVASVFGKGSYEGSWVEDNEFGVRAIDLRKPLRLKSIVNYNVYVVALYIYEGELIIGLHGYDVMDSYNEVGITFYSENAKGVISADSLMVFNDETLSELCECLDGIDKEKDTWN